MNHNFKVLILFLDKADCDDELDLTQLGGLDDVIHYESDEDGEEFEYYEDDDLDDDVDLLDDEDFGQESDEGDGEEKTNKKLEGAVRFRDRIKSIANIGFKLKLAMNKFVIKTNSFFNRINVGREMFYKKFFGKIDHLYEHYAGEAVIKENELLGDPVQIYQKKALPYLAHLIDSVIKIYNEYMAFNDRLATLKTYNQMVAEANRYIVYNEAKLGDSEEVKPGKLIDSLKKDYRFRVASALLENHKIYGYTIESMVVKKFPPMNHVLVCLFMEKPHEAVKEQSVNEIFETADSFKMMASQFRQSLKGMIDMVNVKLQSVTLSASMTKSNNTFKNFKQNATNKFKMMKNDASVDRGELKETAGDLKKMATVLKDWGALIQSFAPSFLYLADAGGTLFEIMLRIDQTCRLALEAMATVEAGKIDGKYRDATYRFKKKMTPEEMAEAKAQKEANDPNRFKKPITQRDGDGNMVTFK